MQPSTAAEAGGGFARCLGRCRRRHPVLVLVGFLVLYAAAVALGRATRIEDTQLALVWPAAAVGFLWLAASWGDRRALLRDGLLLAVVAGGINLLTGVRWEMAVVFAAANVVQSLLVCLVLVRLQDRWTLHRFRLRSTGDLTALVLASLLGSVAAALLGPVGLWLVEGTPLLPTAGAWILRNAASVFIFAALALRVADPEARDDPQSWKGWTELGVASAVIVTAYAAVFGLESNLPLGFLLLPLSMWVALRFHTTFAAAHVLLAGVFIVVMTLQGLGPFGGTAPATRVLLAQAFVSVAGLVTLVLALQRDDRRRLVDSLQLATESAHRFARERDEASRAKSAFLATMSHEIRTPLNGVLGLTDLLTQADLPEEEAGWARQASRSGRALLTIVNDVLDLSKVEAGAIELEAVPFRVSDVVHEAVLPVRLAAEEAGLALVVAVSPALREDRTGDPSRLRQVITNLASNAVKFTEQGSVTVTVGGDLEQLWVQVTDTGIGMTQEQQDRLFTPFAQADASVTRRFGGTGLGLAIAGGLVERMAGTITVSSAPGRGSSFRLDVPLPARHDDGRPARAATVALRGPRPAPSASGTVTATVPSGEDPPPSTLRLLVAEDNEVNQLVARLALQRVGVDVDVVGDGAQALDALHGGGYDGLLLDLQMPVLDGLQTTLAIRAGEAQDGRTRLPVFAMTASVLATDREACLRAGMDGVLPKPWTAAQLTDVLDRITRARAHVVAC
ncbi:ATP-binding protein [Aquipuribacter sp. MA13-6]|uniref:hybrid sensor histidine kinase/response regulator n=1 Tax=unclassified Aquipuribacter TaxID=2635084 RepID=UPI003EEADD7A